MTSVVNRTSKMLAVILAILTMISIVTAPVSAASISTPSKPKVSVQVVGRVRWQDIRGWADKDAKVTWNKVSGAAGYQIVYTVNGSTRTEYSSTNSDTLSFGACPYPLKLNYCKVKVRAYKYEGRRKIYSNWSSTRSFWV